MLNIFTNEVFFVILIRVAYVLRCQLVETLI